MGYCSALGMIDAAGETVALRWHLQHNHYPPIPEAMVAVAVRALKYARAGSPWDRRLRLPAGITHRVTGRFATLAALVEHMHLDAFLDAREEAE